MKILCLIESIGPGGAERQLTGLAVLLKKSGHDVIVITYSENKFYLPFLVKNNVDFEYVEEAVHKVNRIQVISRVISNYSPDFVISYLDGPNIVACLLKVFGKKFKLIVSERNTYYKGKITLRDIIKFNLYKNADYIVANSVTQTEFISNRFSSLTKKLFTITNFSDTNIFSPIRNQIIEKTIQCICVGRVVPQKNVHLFVKAIARLKEKGYRLKVKWYGKLIDTDEYSSICLNLIKEYSLEEMFIFKKPTELIHKEYQKANLFCLPSLYEGYPNVLCEAMSAGLPILCSNVSDNPILVKHGKNGFIFDPTDLNEIVNSFVKFFALSIMEQKQMGICNRTKALSTFSEDVFLNKYLNLIESENY